MPKQKGLSEEQKLALTNELGKVLQTLPIASWYPQTGPQSLAYISAADELFFGGSAGGGKTDLLYGLGRTAHVNSLFLRSESTQLTGVKKRVQELLEEGDRWQGIGAHGGILRTSDGRTMEFSGCESISAANKKFRGRDHDLKLWDELPTIPKDVFTFVNGWNRTTIVGQRTRVVGAGNPPSKAEEEWVIDYWSPWLRDMTAEPGEIVWFAKIENEDVQVESNEPIIHKKEVIYPRSRTFIPARLEDNPLLERTGYRQVLLNMPEPYKSQLLYGDMNIGLTDDAHQLIPTGWIDLAMKRWEDRDINKLTLTSVGIDPAREGKDRSVIAKKYDNWVAPLIVIPKSKTPDGPRLAVEVLLNIESNFAPLIIDITGTAGGGLYDSLGLMAHRVAPYAFVAAAKSFYMDKSGRIKMRNKRTEAYWRLREALDPTNENAIALPRDKDLRTELAAQRWYMFASGAGIEEKDEITKRLQGKSPDKADAVAMSMMLSDATAGWVPDPPKRHNMFMGSDLAQKIEESAAEHNKPRPQDTGGWVP